MYCGPPNNVTSWTQNILAPNALGNVFRWRVFVGLYKPLFSVCLQHTPLTTAITYNFPRQELGLRADSITVCCITHFSTNSFPRHKYIASCWCKWGILYKHVIYVYVKICLDVKLLACMCVCVSGWRWHTCLEFLEEVLNIPQQPLHPEKLFLHCLKVELRI